MVEFDFSQSILMLIAATFAAGVATSLTPCVYPMIPIVVGYLGNQTGNSRQRFLRAFFYVLGMSLVYALLGLFAALSGRFFGDITNNLFVYLIFGVFILVLGGSMMDWYVIPLPRLLQIKAKTEPGKLSLVAAFFVGMTTGLVASPCTAPVLAALLAYIAGTHDVIRGGVLMFSFSLGLNLLLIVLGYSSGILQTLPRSGLWMVRVKKIMALLMMVGGLYFVFKAGQIS